jgi:hypothetical protein
LPRIGDGSFTHAARSNNNYRKLRQRCNIRAVFQSRTDDYRRLAGEHAPYVAPTMQHTQDDVIGDRKASQATA